MLVVGGGAVLDKAGLACALYKRGVQVDYMPTTLLAMVDAALGGKTAVNLEAKNMVGVFREPGKIIIYGKWLDTLPDRHWSNGMAEAIKTAYVYD